MQNVLGDTVIQQTRIWYDAASQPVAMATYERFPGDDTTEGPLDATNSYTTASAVWYDGRGRVIATADFGREDVDAAGWPHYVFHTTGGTDAGGNYSAGELIDVDRDGIPDVAEDVPPEPLSLDPNSLAGIDFQLSVTQYNAAGYAYRALDNLGRITETQYDLVGHVVRTIQNYDGLAYGGQGSGFDQYGFPLETSTECDVTVDYQYDSAGRLVTMTAYNAKGDDDDPNTENVEPQQTCYLYEAALTGWLQTAVVYPDSGDTLYQDPATHLWTIANDTGDHVSTTYDVMGRVAATTDQRGVVHWYSYNPDGRLLRNDVVDQGSLVSAGVDDSVFAIEWTYDDLGRVETVYSVGSSGVCNMVVYRYDGWGHLVQEWQSHGGWIDPNTPSVQYVYDDGLAPSSTDQPAPYVRLAEVVYPTDSQSTGYDYGALDSIDYVLSRVAAVTDGPAGPSAPKLAAYTYLGMGTIAKTAHPEVYGGLDLDYGIADNVYGGLDRFGRVVDEIWRNTSGDVLDGYRYGYDLSGNRWWKQNMELNAAALDELYTYDDLGRLTGTARGTLTGLPDSPAISTPAKYQDWTLLDSQGNFGEFDDDGTVQTREVNAANETGEIKDDQGQPFWVTPEYDRAGNMISGPQPGDETTRVHYAYDAWNRLVGVYADDPENPGERGDLIAAYSYDGLNRRIDKTLANNTGTEYYYNQGWQLLESRSLNISGQTVATDQYVWDQSYIDAPVVRLH